MLSRLYLTFLLGALASLVVALPVFQADSDPIGGEFRACGVNISAEHARDAERLFQSRHHDYVPENATATLNVYFHVVFANRTMEGGYLSVKQVLHQMEVMNRDYNTTGIQWRLKAINGIHNEDWFLNVAPNSTEEVAMKEENRMGGKGDLNVYSVGFASAQAELLLGIATFPMDYNTAPELDGVMILHSTLPGGKSARFGLGRTLVHEAGHWVGLYHTFQGGCGAPGDGVDDTPAEASPATGCPRRRDTCPGSPGLDPVRNFMDYTDDSCKTNFTPGQAKRMRHQLVAYRGVKFT